MIVDSHCHLDHPMFEGKVSEVVERARESGVQKILTIACVNDDFDQDRYLGILEDYEGIFGAVGVHPHDASAWGDARRAELKSLLGHPRVIALGEIGLDFYYENSPREEQQDAFAEQLDLATELGLPFVIHTRDAEPETLDLLQKQHERSGFSGGILHCFSGTEVLARGAIDLGLHLGLGGILTFKRSDPLRGIVRELPLERLLLETDAPYLAPQPVRGKRNEPAFVRYVAEELAVLFGVSLAETARITRRNFGELFPGTC